MNNCCPFFRFQKAENFCFWVSKKKTQTAKKLSSFFGFFFFAIDFQKNKNKTKKQKRDMSEPLFCTFLLVGPDPSLRPLEGAGFFFLFLFFSLFSLLPLSHFFFEKKFKDTKSQGCVFLNNLLSTTYSAATLASFPPKLPDYVPPSIWLFALPRAIRYSLSSDSNQPGFFFFFFFWGDQEILIYLFIFYDRRMFFICCFLSKWNHIIWDIADIHETCRSTNPSKSDR